MATTLHIDILEGDYVETTDGRKMTRQAIVEGLSGTASKRLKDALDAEDVPDVGDLHPTISGMRVIEKRAKSAGDTVVKITLTYSSKSVVGPGGDPGDPGVPVYETGSVLQQLSVNIDKNGSQITVKNSHDANEHGEFVSVPIPSSSATVTIVQRGISPQQIADTYVGTVNKTEWNEGDSGFWLCTEVRGSSNDGGLTWVMRYSFAKARDNILIGSSLKTIAWNPSVVTTDAAGKPIENPVSGTSIKEVNIYEEAEFHDLGI